MKRVAAALTAVLVAGLLAAPPARGQQYPNKPIRIVVPFAAGGTSDILARAIGPHITTAWGQPVIVENRAGANGHVGADYVAKSASGGAPHLAGVEFAARTGVQWTYIPYKGGSAAVTDVVAGNANVLFNGMLATYPSVKGGRLKGLAVSSAQRVPSAPELPTV